MKGPSKRNRRRLVRCLTHGEMEGYVVCRHVADGLAPTFFVEHPGESHPTLGTIVCLRCTHSSGKGLGDLVPAVDLVLVCGFCARDRGINRVVVPKTSVDVVL